MIIVIVEENNKGNYCVTDGDDPDRLDDILLTFELALRSLILILVVYIIMQNRIKCSFKILEAIF